MGPKSKANIQYDSRTILLYSLLLLASALMIIADYIARIGDRVPLSIENIKMATLLFFLGVFLKLMNNPAIKILLFIVGIIIIGYLNFSYSFICFDECPKDFKTILGLVITASALFGSIYSYLSIKNKSIRTGIIFLIFCLALLSISKVLIY